MTGADAAAASILDASALLALMQDEVGAGAVEQAITAGAAISSVNFSETLSKLEEGGAQPGTAASAIWQALQGVEGVLHVEPFSEEDAIEAATLRPRTRAQGLSLADRACLALAARLEVPAFTADRSWTELTEVGVVVRLIR